MKKILGLMAVAVISMAGTVNTHAETSIYASYGGYTQMDACDNHDGWSGVNTAWGAVNAGVDFRVAPKFRIGPSYTFSSTSTKGGKDASHIAYHSILLNVKYDYYKNRIVTVYAHGGIGVVISHLQPKGFDSYNKAYFAGQISPVGAEVGISNGFKMFGELGFGSQGLVQVGFRLNL
ncbi:MAG: outer membrane beta-barrel protein [Muribaculaceae bacterium]|nr:outer membrane beta-barrel protein [Muribaculaceae bacterium]